MAFSTIDKMHWITPKQGRRTKTIIGERNLPDLKSGGPYLLALTCCWPRRRKTLNPKPGYTKLNIDPGKVVGLTLREGKL